MKLSLKDKGHALSEFFKIKNSCRAMMLLMLPLLAWLALVSNFAQADDLMAKGQQTVTDTFGAKSSIANWIVLAEVIVGIITYIKTKNMFMLFGIAIVIVFTTIGFGLVV